MRILEAMLQPWWDEISLVQCSPCGKAAKASKGSPLWSSLNRPQISTAKSSNSQLLPSLPLTLSRCIANRRAHRLLPSLLLAAYEAFCSGLVKLSSALPSCRPPRACQTGRHNCIMLGPKSLVLVDNCTTPLTRGSSVGLHTALALDP